MALTLGEQLQQARAKRGVTLDQAAQATHVRKHYLEALENDQREALPSTVQGRGFLRLYADYLDLPSADLLAAWEQKETYSPDLSDAPQFETKDQSKARKVKPPISPQANEDQQIPELPPLDEAAGSSSLTSQGIFKEIGQNLRQQREALGLSLSEVERYTRLRQHYILALENGRMEELPSAVQGRGMLSNYAAFLNLKEDTVLLRYAEGLQARRTERIPKPEPEGVFSTKKRPARQAPLWRRFLTPDLIFGFGVVTIILFFALWTAARINSLDSENQIPTPQDISSILLTPAEDRLVNPQTSETPYPGEPTGGLVDETVVSAETSLPAETIGSTTLLPPTATDQPASADPADLVPTATLQPLNNDPLQVYIVARQRAWLRVVSDDKVKFLGRVIPGNAYAFSGSKQIELTTGNAAALQVFYNQSDLGTLGISGQAIGMVFSPEGVMTPTPAFTATSTPTKPATVTPLPTMTPLPSPTITPFIP